MIKIIDRVYYGRYQMRNVHQYGDHFTFSSYSYSGIIAGNIAGMGIL